MSWRPNRRWLRDVGQLLDRNHRITYSKTATGKLCFYIDGMVTTHAELADAAKWYRERKPMTADEFASILIDAKALATSLQWE